MWLLGMGDGGGVGKPVTAWTISEHAWPRWSRLFAKKWLVLPRLSQEKPGWFMKKLFSVYCQLIVSTGAQWSSWSRSRKSSHVVPHTGWRSRGRETECGRGWSWLRSKDKGDAERQTTLSLRIPQFSGQFEWNPATLCVPFFNIVRSLYILSKCSFLPQWTNAF